MTKLADRKPRQMSGGQQQRVAVARALVNRPSVLLLDEPLGALDRKLREEMQIELKLLQSQLGITFIFVTHDQEEAMSMSDRIAIMLEGHIEQLADPETVYERPVSAFVAGFIGRNNFWRGIATDDGVIGRRRHGVRRVDRPEERVARGRAGAGGGAAGELRAVGDRSRATTPTCSPARWPASPTSATRCSTSCATPSRDVIVLAATPEGAAPAARRPGVVPRGRAADVYQFSAAQAEPRARRTSRQKSAI